MVSVAISCNHGGAPGHLWCNFTSIGAGIPDTLWVGDGEFGGEVEFFLRASILWPNFSFGAAKVFFLARAVQGGRQPPTRPSCTALGTFPLLSASFLFKEDISTLSPSFQVLPSVGVGKMKRIPNPSRHSPSKDALQKGRHDMIKVFFVTGVVVLCPLPPIPPPSGT